ncbi:hypothetical protein ACFLIN_09210 [Corynebacterium kutscheri]|nr:hypothetical protein [Corynebacterium kutscheri]
MGKKKRAKYAQQLVGKNSARAGKVRLDSWEGGKPYIVFEGRRASEERPINPLGMKIKKKCCRRNPRCINCPVVYSRMSKQGAWAADKIIGAAHIEDMRHR